MNNVTESLVTIALAIVGVSVLALIVSKKLATASVIQAAASAFGNSLSVALSPVTGTAVQPNLSYPSDASGGMTGFGGFSPSTYGNLSYN